MTLELYSYFNPYYNQHFFGFFWVLLERIWGFLTGELSYDALVADEIQVIVLAGVACSSALVGVLLVLRKMTMLANSISHTILIGIVAAFVLTKKGFFGESRVLDGINAEAMLLASLFMGGATAFLTEFLTKSIRLQEDASTGLVFTTLFAVGIILATLLTRDAHIGQEAVMGNVDALHLDDIRLIGMILAGNALLVALFYKEYLLTTFDPGLARALGYSTVFFNYLLMMQAAATVVGAFRAVGVLMVLAFITGPVLTARLLTHNFKTLLFLAMFIGAAASLVGVALARHLLTAYDIALSTGGVVVCTIGACYLITLMGQSLRTLFYRYFLDRKILKGI